MRDLQNLVHDLRERGVTLKATEQPIDTSTAAAKCFLDMLGVFAEFETNLRKERQMEGIARPLLLSRFSAGRPPEGLPPRNSKDFCYSFVTPVALFDRWLSSAQNSVVLVSSASLFKS